VNVWFSLHENLANGMLELFECERHEVNPRAAIMDEDISASMLGEDD